MEFVVLRDSDRDSDNDSNNSNGNGNDKRNGNGTAQLHSAAKYSSLQLAVLWRTLGELRKLQYCCWNPFPCGCWRDS